MPLKTNSSPPGWLLCKHLLGRGPSWGENFHGFQVLLMQTLQVGVKDRPGIWVDRSPSK